MNEARHRAGPAVTVFFIKTCNQKTEKREREEKRMKVRITGVKKSSYKGKDGSDRTGFNYSGLKDYTRYETENADCDGQDVIREFSSTDFGVHPGDEVEFIYEPGYQDKATLVDVKVLGFAGGNPFADKKDSPQEKAGADTKDKKQAGVS